MRRCILFFVKFPEPGKVKTRLAATLGAERAAEIYRELAETALKRIAAEEEVIVMFDPPEKREAIAAWLRAAGKERTLHFVPQVAGDLGVRLERAFAAAFAEGHEAVAAIGSDCVELAPEHFAEAWQALATHDAVLGPTEDGGYYLLALRAPSPALFQDIAWSTEAVFQQTLDRAAEASLRTHLLPKLRDVDTEEDWRRVGS